MSQERNKKEGMLVASICNGIVLDHIPTAKLFKVVELLQLHNIQSPITIGNNFESSTGESKGIIKIADVEFDQETLNRIAIIAPNVTLNIIENYEVVRKDRVQLPNDIIGLVKCRNKKCITNHEPMATHFRVADKNEGILYCHYCDRKVAGEQIQLNESIKY